MALKDSLRLRFEKLADDVVPQLLDSWGDLQKRLDDLNCSLANRAVPASCPFRRKRSRRDRIVRLCVQLKRRARARGQSEFAQKPYAFEWLAGFFRKFRENI